MSSLFEIDERLRALEEYQVDTETGEIVSDEEFYKLLDELQIALSDKIENTLCFVKELRHEVDAFKAEEKSLAERRKTKENLANRLQKRINDYITWQYTDEDGNVNYEQLNKYKLDTPKVKVSYRKSDTLEVVDIDKIPKEFKKVVKETTVDKAELKKAIKNGLKCNGAEIKTNYNMQLK